MFNSDTTDLLDPSITQAATKFMDIISAENSEVKREAGLFVTTRNIQAIKNFVRAANELPVELDQVRYLLRYRNSDIPGLEPEDIQSLYLDIQSTAQRWPDVELNMKTVGASFVTFSDNLDFHGSGIIQYIEKLESFSSVPKKIGELTDPENTSIPYIPLSDNDTPKIDSLVALAQELVAVINEKKTEAATIKSLMSTFKSDLRTLESKVALKRKLALTTADSPQLAESNAEIDNLNKQIEEQLRTYETYTKYTWIGAWWGPIGLAISASIYGPEAAQVRKNIDKLTDRKYSRINKQKETASIINSLISLETDMQDLQLRIDDAAASASHLESLWLVTLSYIENSISQLVKTNNATLLVLFCSRLQVMIENWRKVKIQSQTLLSVFSDAIEHA
ncbi:MAG: binary cytotoxin component [Pseudomonas sp.]|nr:binary cytotoxin component [Pseudomonas sp.]